MTLPTREMVRFDAVQATITLTKRKTPRERHKEKRIEEIAAVAVKLFAKEGMAGFSMRRVASLAGITLSTLQHHFGNQRNLLIITINSFGSHYMEMLHSIGHDTSIAPKERFDKVIEQLIAWTVDPILASAYWELYVLANKDDVIAKLVDKIFAIYYGTLADIVAELNPRLSQARARTIGVMIGTQLDGLTLFHRHGVATKLPMARLVSAMKVGWMDEIARP